MAGTETYTIDGETFTKFDTTIYGCRHRGWACPNGWEYPSLALAASTYFGRDVNVHEAVSAEGN